jgi:hypothetical protein
MNHSQQNQVGFVQLLHPSAGLIIKSFLALAWLCAKFTTG